ncbi:MAG TPA: DUF732 domain-containing protein [Mycobacterium sp.]|nr:DUF732 domain-containing protein [Mycobacterium sp.]
MAASRESYCASLPRRAPPSKRASAVEVGRSELHEFHYFYYFASPDAPILTAPGTPTTKEGHNMLPPRWLAKLIIPVLVGAALTSSTAIAMADSTDDTYLTKLHGLGFSWNSGSDSDMIAIGHQICADRSAGKTPDAIAADIHSSLSSKGYSFADVTGMVSAAESTYCPD